MTEKTVKDKPAEEKVKLVPGQPDYAAMYEKAKKEGKLTRPTFRIHTWKEDSAVLIGKVVDVKPFTGGKFEEKANVYLIETVEGKVSCVLGSYTDSQLEGIDLVKKIIRIEFTGKKELEDARSVNNFNVDLLESEV